MDLNDFPGAEPTVVDLRADNCWEAIDELVDHLVAAGRIKPDQQGALVAAVKQREAAMSTGIGFGIAIPHASTDLVSELVVIIGRSRKGIQSEAADRKSVHLMVLFLVPTGRYQEYPHLLADLAGRLRSEGFRNGP